MRTHTDRCPFHPLFCFDELLWHGIFICSTPVYDTLVRTEEVTMNTPSAKASPLLIILAYVGFVSLGLPDAVIGVAWPSLRDHFQLPQSALGLVFVFSGCGYFLSSFFSGRAVQVLGIGLLLAGSTALVASSALGFAFSPVWWALLAFAILHGLGSGAIDAGLNGYAASHMSAGHMNWLHACYCLGAMLGPFVMTWALTTNGTYSLGYTIIGSVMLALAILFALTRPLWGRAAPKASEESMGTWETLCHPVVLLQMAVFFLYTGLEVTVGQWTFTLLTESRQVGTATAGVWVGAYWGCIGVGRVLFGFVVEKVGIDSLVRYALLTAAGGAVLLAIPEPVECAYAGLVLIGLGLAPVFPCLMTRTPERLGPALATHAVGFQVGTAMVGAAAIPAGTGIIVGEYGLETVGPAAVILACLVWLLHEFLVRQQVDAVKPSPVAP
jgi:fucose permease